MADEPSSTVEARGEDATLWYHTLELPGGVVTPGWFDLRRHVGRLPWPDVQGERCLDVGTYDGFYAFELERRGAAEVVATDIADHRDWDWPAAMRAHGGEALAALAGQKGRGFEIAKNALGSSVEKREINVYDLSTEEVGAFDVVVCGDLLLHLRDPVRALEAMRSVCRGWFLSVEQVSLGLTVRFPRRPTADLVFDETLCQWWVVNVAGHRRLVQSAGFQVVKTSPLYCEPFGVGHPRRRDSRARVGRVGRRLLTGNDGVPHAAVLARPRLEAPPVRW